jgi:uncharacterized protein
LRQLNPRTREGLPILNRDDINPEDDGSDPSFEWNAEGADEPELTGPMRLCALTRTPYAINDLIRFGAGLDGVVVPDLALRLPGRGVWVCGHRVRVEEAVRRNVFAKSLKRAVKPPADLAARIDALMEKRLLEMLSLGNKAGLVTPGFAKVEAALEQGNVIGVFHGSDGATDGKEKLDRKFTAINLARNFSGLIVNELTIDQISLAIGRSNVVHAAILSGGVAMRVLDEAQRLTRYRASPDAL